jgi:type I restriction enzyme S subunit
MSSDSESLTLEQCLDALIDYRGKTPTKTPFGIPLITAKIIKNGRIEQPNEFIAEDGYDSWMRRGIPQAGDVVLTVEAPLGEVAQLGMEKVALAQRVVTLRGKQGVLDSTYLLYLLQTDEIQNQLKARSTGTTVFGIKQSELRKIELNLPSINVQVSAARTLKIIDDRITLLRETNATLEAIAQAIFKSWFVDFDPVKAKQEGRIPEGMDEETAALFSDSFEESELGMIPRGWRVDTVDSLCSVITNGGTPSRSNKTLWDGGTVPWFKTGDFNDGFLLSPSERITSDALKQSSVKLLPAGAVLMAIYAAPTVGRLGILTESATFNQACTGMVAKREIGTWFLYWTLYTARAWFNNRANGAAQQNISKAIVGSCPVITPSEQVLMAFNHLAAELHGKILSNSLQAQTLTGIRDTLLPRLISGKIRLPGSMTSFNGSVT